MSLEPTPADDQHAPDAIRDRLARAHQQVAEAARSAGRDPASVRLLLATKTVPAAGIRAALTAPVPTGVGRPLMGENRVQELVAKGPELADLDPETHLIGNLQRNKVNHALRWASCVQSVDTIALATRLSDRCTEAGRVLDVLVQVNVTGEATKFGLDPAAAPAFASEVATLPGVRLRGFMTIGAHSSDTGLVRSGYERLRQVRDDVVASGASGTEEATELSMGMSGDFALAIEAGATMVRLGSAIFGARPY